MLAVMSDTSITSGIATAPDHGGVLSIDLGAVADNYRFLSLRAKRAETAASVKGNAYGLGLEKIAGALRGVGCSTFFVAHIGEAAALRQVYPDPEVTIYVLNGLLPSTVGLYPRINARPVLGSIEEIQEWAIFASTHEAPPAAVQIDTGFTRLGLTSGDKAELAEAASLVKGIDVSLVMSHLACGDDPNHCLNVKQLEQFETARQYFPNVPASLANSAGIALGSKFRFNMVRPGIALYGGTCNVSGANDMRQVVSLNVPIIQLRTAPARSTAGYGATYRFPIDRRIALVSLGYADGFARIYSASNTQFGGQLFLNGTSCPVVGRISMDITAIDVSHLDKHIAKRGAQVEVLGPNQTIDDLARLGKTIPYEVLTRLGLRHRRVYSTNYIDTRQSGVLPT